MDPSIEARIAALEAFRNRFGGSFGSATVSNAIGEDTDPLAAVVDTSQFTSRVSGSAAPLSSIGPECLIGEVGLFAGNFAPRGSMFTHGQLLPISSYSALFSILGTTYGGDGRTTFALPDLRGLEPEGVNYVMCVEGLYPSRS